MQEENEAAFTPKLLRKQLKAMADLDLSDTSPEMIGLFGGLVATMNMLQPEGYSETVPALTFQPGKE